MNKKIINFKKLEEREKKTRDLAFILFFSRGHDTSAGIENRGKEYLSSFPILVDEKDG